ncbi:MAG: Xaa-Pro peptidase family protein [Clostridiales bacterium]|jgi:Xaa-Pro dipeptidase|nr:Xaa-Pro peptidase family protein [Clostridiales bacterium]
MSANRIEKTLENLRKMGVGQLLVSDVTAIYYLTGQYLFPGERLLLLRLSLTKGNTLYVNELSQVEGTVEGVDVVQFALGEDGLARVADDLDKNAVLGLDKDLPARFLLPLLEKAGGSGPAGIKDIVLASQAVDRVRAVKDAEEQALMAQSSEINDRAMAEFETLVKEGVTELEIKERLDGIYRALGADSIAFGIVAFGANAAEPHHNSDNTALKAGDCVLLDVGCIKSGRNAVCGYCSDMTRTFFYKYVSPRHTEIYEIVKSAVEAAERLVRPGIRFSELDAAARDIIDKAGYGKNFIHRLGHSIGLQGHEAGDVSAYNHDELEEGMIFSIEPGIYLPGDVGVRIEDLMLVTPDGGRSLNLHPKDLKILG